MLLFSVEDIKYYPQFPAAIPGLGARSIVFLALSPLVLRPVRLACFNHAASVQSEPESNSSVEVHCPLRRLAPPSRFHSTRFDLEPRSYEQSRSVVSLTPVRVALAGRPIRNETDGLPSTTFVEDGPTFFSVARTELQACGLELARAGLFSHRPHSPCGELERPSKKLCCRTRMLIRCQAVNSQRAIWDESTDPARSRRTPLSIRHTLVTLPTVHMSKIGWPDSHHAFQADFHGLTPSFCQHCGR